MYGEWSGLSRILNFDQARERAGKKYRYSLEIVRDMLLIASVKVRKTRMMYQANLSFRQSEKYLKSLLESGLIDCHDDSCYLITKRGKDFLQMYDDYLERNRRINEEINGAHKDKLLLENMCFNNECNSKRIANRKEVSV